jgi:hypothetical protein
MNIKFVMNLEPSSGLLKKSDSYQDIAVAWA